MQDFERSQYGIHGYTQIRLGGVLSPNLRTLVVRQQLTPDMTLQVLGSGTVWIGHTPITFIDSNTPSIVAPAANPRYALLTLDDGGVLSWEYGSEAAVPLMPDTPFGALVLCAVYQRVAMSSILDEDDGVNGYVYEDYRPFLLVPYVMGELWAKGDETDEYPNSLTVNGGDYITLDYSTPNAVDIDWDGVRVERVGSYIGTQPILNFIAGSGVGVNVSDDGTEIDITISNTSPGVTDHGALTGLSHNDHTQYILGGYDPIKESGQYVYLDYNTSDFGVSSGELYIKDSGIDHGGLSGLSHNDHTQYVNAAGSGLSMVGQALNWDGVRVERVGSYIGTRPILNYIAGSGVGISVSDDGTEIDITISNTSPGVTDHGALTGLSHDDHTQYLNIARHAAIGNSSPHHASTTVYGAPLTISGQQIRFNYNTSDFGVSGNYLYIKNSGIDHGGLSGLSHNDHTQYVNAAGSGLSLVGQTLSWGGLTVKENGVTRGTERTLDLRYIYPIEILAVDSGTEIDATISLNYNVSDFGVSGGNLYIKNSGINHDGISGVSANDHHNRQHSIAIGADHTADNLDIGSRYFEGEAFRSNAYDVQLIPKNSSYMHIRNKADTAYLGLACDKIYLWDGGINFTGSHDELNDVSTNDHHNKSHDHSSASGSGAIDTNQSATFDSYVYVNNYLYLYSRLYCGGSGQTGYIYVRDSSYNTHITLYGDTGNANFDGNVDIEGNLDAHQGVDIDAGYSLKIGNDCEWHRDAANQIGTPDSVRVDARLGVARGPTSGVAIDAQGTIRAYQGNLHAYRGHIICQQVGSSEDRDIMCMYDGSYTIILNSDTADVLANGTIWAKDNFRIGGTPTSQSGGSAGVSGTFIDNNGNTITVSGGIITSLS